MSDKTGGQAFPLPYAQSIDGGVYLAEQGMKLRDWFAGHAMNGLFTMPAEWRSYFGKDGCGSTWADEAAKAAYTVADAMLKARES